jgi:hypothetical protein
MKYTAFFLFLLISCTLEAQVNVKLVNQGAQVIPLFIPGIMNPNLSPFSESNVTFPLGQKVYYGSKRGKNQCVVLEVTAEWPADTIIYLNRNELDRLCFGEKKSK